MTPLAEKLGKIFRRNRTEPVQVDSETSGPPAKRSARGREAAIQRLEEGYTQVLDTMQSLRQHMEAQAQRSDKLISMMEGIPEVLRSIPETNKRQTEVLQAMQGHIESQSKTTNQLSTALTDLAGVTERQQTALTEFQKQMDASRASTESLRDSLGILSETMETMTDASKSNVDAVNAIAAQSRSNQDRTESLYKKAQRQSTIMSSVSWAMALAALAVSGYVAVMVTKVADRQPLADQTPPAQVQPQATAGIGGGASDDAAAQATPADATASGQTSDAATGDRGSDVAAGESTSTDEASAATDATDADAAGSQAGEATDAEPTDAPAGGGPAETAEADDAATGSGEASEAAADEPSDDAPKAEPTGSEAPTDQAQSDESVADAVAPLDLIADFWRIDADRSAVTVPLRPAPQRDQAVVSGALLRPAAPLGD